MQSFDDNQPVIVVTDIPGGSTTQTAIQRISDNKLLYVVTGMNLGLVMSLSFLSLSQDDEDNKNKIRDAIEESQKGIYLVNDVISCNDYMDKLLYLGHAIIRWMLF